MYGFTKTISNDNSATLFSQQALQYYLKTAKKGAHFIALWKTIISSMLTVMLKSVLSTFYDATLNHL